MVVASINIYICMDGDGKGFSGYKINILRNNLLFWYYKCGDEPEEHAFAVSWGWYLSFKVENVGKTTLISTIFS